MLQSCSCPGRYLVPRRIKTLEVLRLDGASYRLIATHGGDERVRAEPFAELELAAVWNLKASHEP